MRLSAGIIAGGFSRRMGADKALLPDPTHGTLLQRQLHVLEMLAPDEVLLSCRRDQRLPAPDSICRVYDDGAHGPLAGLAALLTAMRGEIMLVLAVDLGRMSVCLLQRLVQHATTTCGVVPRTSRGPEPLAAVYPATLALEARQRLESQVNLSLQSFVGVAAEAGRIRWLDVTADEQPCFANWNSPQDLPPQAREG